MSAEPGLDKAEALRRSPLFELLSRVELEVLAELSRPRRFAPEDHQIRRRAVQIHIVLCGPAHFVDSESNIVHTEAGPVVLYGVSQLLVVTLDGITFVTTLDRARDLKPLLDALPGSLRLRPTRTKPA